MKVCCSIGLHHGFDFHHKYFESLGELSDTTNINPLQIFSEMYRPLIRLPPYRRQRNFLQQQIAPATFQLPEDLSPFPSRKGTFVQSGTKVRCSADYHKYFESPGEPSDTASTNLLRIFPEMYHSLIKLLSGRWQRDFLQLQITPATFQLPEDLPPSPFRKGTFVRSGTKVCYLVGLCPDFHHKYFESPGELSDTANTNPLQIFPESYRSLIRLLPYRRQRDFLQLRITPATFQLPEDLSPSPFRKGTSVRSGIPARQKHSSGLIF